MATADPVRVPVTEGGWRIVATNVTNVSISVLETRPTYAWTYRLTGGAAPTDATEGVPMGSITKIFCAVSAVDIYIWCNGQDGEVRRDVDFQAEYLIDA